MNETCKSCGTVYHLDESIVSSKIVWLKCSVCNEKWSFSINNKTELEIRENSESFSKKNSRDIEINKVKDELASIKLVVENKSKQLSDSKNSILELKNKSVAEIAAELSASKLKTIKTDEAQVSNKIKKEIKIKKVKFFPYFLFIFCLFISISLFYRSTLVSYSYIYFPVYAEKYIYSVNNFFNLIKLPILTDTKFVKITDFGATFQKNEVKFFGFLKNNSSQPVMLPKIKVLAVTEDGKILIEKIILVNKKVLKPYSKIKFSEAVKLNFNKDNISVRATILKEIF